MLALLAACDGLQLLLLGHDRLHGSVDGHRGIFIRFLWLLKNDFGQLVVAAVAWVLQLLLTGGVQDDRVLIGQLLLSLLVHLHNRIKVAHELLHSRRILLIALRLLLLLLL